MYVLDFCIAGSKVIVRNYSPNFYAEIITIIYKRKKPFRGNGTASNDCLPYEKSLTKHPGASFPPQNQNHVV